MKGKKQIIEFKRREKLFDLFCLLVSALPEKVSTENCYTTIWGGNYTPYYHTNTVHTAIRRLRQMLNEIPQFENVIITTQEGYRLSQQFEYVYAEKSMVSSLNERQLDLLQNMTSCFTKEQYMQKYNVSLRTAHRDIQQLISLEKLKTVKDGREVMYQKIQ